MVEPNLGFGTIEDGNQVVLLSQIILMLSPDPYFYQINPFLSIFEGSLVFWGDWVPVMHHFSDGAISRGTPTYPLLIMSSTTSSS